jgi:broad specificity phosphatase PhoE
MRIIFVRHGRTRENEKGILQGHLPGTLSALGRRQAGAIAAALEGTRIDRIYTSDLRRALATARVIARTHRNAKVVPTKALRENYLGDMQGTKPKRRFLLDYMDGRLDKHGVEPPQAFYARMRKFLVFLAQKHKNETILLVSHGMTFRFFVAVIRNKPWRYVRRLKHLQSGEIAIFEVKKKGKFESRLVRKELLLGS